jgi:hypothetical protein
MESKLHIIPQVAVKGIATGLIMMACFTLIWAAIAFGGLHTSAYAFILIIFPLLAIVFVAKGIAIFRVAKYYPQLTDEADIAREKKTGKWFGIIFGAEGLGIFIAINIVTNLGHPELTIPVIALVVGLHFYPLAKVFRRKVDYYLATWSTLIAIAGIIFSLKHIMPFNYVLGFIGTGLAIATSCYGSYMVISGNKALKQLPAEAAVSA